MGHAHSSPQPTPTHEPMQPRHSPDNARRRKSIELPDLAASLYLTQDADPSGSRRNPGKGSATTAVDPEHAQSPQAPLVALATSPNPPIRPPAFVPPPPSPPSETIVPPTFPAVPIPLVPPPSLPHASPVLSTSPSASPHAPAALLAAPATDSPAHEAIRSATVDFGAGSEGIPTVVSWAPHAEAAEPEPESVFVTGTFANSWATKVQLRKKSDSGDYSAVLNLKPGAHRLKFVVNQQWKTSRHLPSATDTDGNLINYLQVARPTNLNVMRSATQTPVDPEIDSDKWTDEIPPELLLYASDEEDEHEVIASESASLTAPPSRDPVERPASRPSSALNDTSSQPHSVASPDPASSSQQQNQSSRSAGSTPNSPKKKNIPPPPPPPALPAQLEKGVLNQAMVIQPGSGDDNSILPRPDHSVIDHLAASPISKGLLSVGVTKRYKRKYVTTVYYKPVPSPTS